MVNSPNVSRTINCKALNSPVEYPSGEYKHDTKESEGRMFNPIFNENVQGRKHPGSRAFAEPVKDIVKGAHDDTQHQNNTHTKNNPIECDRVKLTKAQCHMVPLSI